VLDRIASESAAAWYRRLQTREGWAREALEGYAGKTARFEAGLLALSLCVESGGWLAAGSAAPDVTITIEPEALMASLFDAQAVLRKMRIEGDAQFARGLTEVLTRLRPDPAEDLSRWLGDAGAQRLVAAVHAGLQALGDAAQRLARQGADYFAAENPMLVGRQEFARYVQELAQLLVRLDRLEAKVGAGGADGA
jgi:ubiquinone biosynthesis protein UbiJ